MVKRTAQVVDGIASDEGNGSRQLVPNSTELVQALKSLRIVFDDPAIGITVFVGSDHRLEVMDVLVRSRDL